jgi:hypothetical protein
MSIRGTLRVTNLLFSKGGGEWVPGWEVGVGWEERVRWERGGDFTKVGSLQGSPGLSVREWQHGEEAVARHPGCGVEKEKVLEGDLSGIRCSVSICLLWTSSSDIYSSITVQNITEQKYKLNM